jgi:hypothetical protein
LFCACKSRNDDVGKLLLENEGAIHSGQLTFKYHKDSRSTYCSKLHLSRLAVRSGDSVGNTSSISVTSSVSCGGGHCSVGVRTETDSVASSSNNITCIALVPLL